MSSSFYRGKLVTNSELKGPFTEACNEFKGTPFNILVQEAEKNTAEISIVRREGRPSSVFIHIGGLGLAIEITEDGGFELFEGGG